MTAPLRGIRVLDLGRFIAAPYCGMILAEMGADVIRVERPGGDDDRRIGLRAANGENLMYPSFAHHKRGITLDLQSADGRALLLRLTAHADVVVHNYSPGAARAFGLSYDELRAVRPDLIYVAITCYGSEGPMADRTGFDPIAQVASGAAAVTGEEVPLRSGVPWTDYSTGLSAALGAVLALRHRDATGEGQVVDCALLATALSYVAPMIAEATVTGRERPRLGNRAAYIGPTDLYRCRDGLVYVAVATDHMWRAFARLVGRPDLLADPELQSDAGRFERRAEIDPLLAAWMAERTVADAIVQLDAARIPCAVYRRTTEVVSDPQVAAMKLLRSLDLQHPGLDQVPASRPPFRLSRCTSLEDARPPRPGEHNDNVYGGILGLEPAQIAALRTARVI